MEQCFRVLVNFVPSSLGNLQLSSVVGSSNLCRFLFCTVTFLLWLLCVWIKNHIHTKSNFWWIQKSRTKNGCTIICCGLEYNNFNYWSQTKWSMCVLRAAKMRSSCFNPYTNRVCVNKQTNKQAMMKVALFSGLCHRPFWIPLCIRFFFFILKNKWNHLLVIHSSQWKMHSMVTVLMYAEFYTSLTFSKWDLQQENSPIHDKEF